MQDLRKSVLKICNFLGKKLTEKEMDDVVDKATFDNMKMDSRANYTFIPSDLLDFSKGNFLRKGRSVIINILGLCFWNVLGFI